jgi:RNA methyltransferase, TrmH family
MTRFRSSGQVIDHRNNPQIKRIRRLHERAERDRTGLFYVEGMRFVARAFRHHVPIEALVVCHSQLTHAFARHLARRQRLIGTPVLDITPDVMASLALADDPQGIGAVVRQQWSSLESIDPWEADSWLMLETVRSPGNLGTILRTSEAVGASGLMLVGDSVDPYDPATVRATMGSLFSQRLVRTNPREFTQWRFRRHYTLVGTAPIALTDYQAVDYRGPTMLLLGNERKGLSPELQAICDIMVRIPMAGETDSLNLSVAASLMLYEVFNQLGMMEYCNLSAIVNLDGMWGDELEANLDRYDRAYPGRFFTFAQSDWSLVTEADFGRSMAHQLADSVRRGARGLKVWKTLGLHHRDGAGKLISIDDPRLFDLWEAAGEASVPVLIHIADPVAFFQPLNHTNEAGRSYMPIPTGISRARSSLRSRR